MGPKYFGLERLDEVGRFLGGLGQSSVEDGYGDEAELYGFAAASNESQKTAAAATALREINSARTFLREAGRPDLVTALNNAATSFQAQLAAATSESQVLQWVRWLGEKIINLKNQARQGTGTATSSNGTPTRRRQTTASSDPMPEPDAGNGDGSTAFLLVGGLALAAAGVYLLMQDAG